MSDFKNTTQAAKTASDNAVAAHDQLLAAVNAAQPESDDIIVSAGELWKQSTIAAANLLLLPAKAATAWARGDDLGQ